MLASLACMFLALTKPTIATSQGLVFGPTMRMWISYYEPRRDHVLHIQNLMPTPIKVFRLTSGYQVSFYDKDGKEFTPKRFLWNSWASSNSPEFWVTLETLDSVAIFLGTQGVLVSDRDAQIAVSPDVAELKRAPYDQQSKTPRLLAFQRPEAEAEAAFRHRWHQKQERRAECAAP